MGFLAATGLARRGSKTTGKKTTVTVGGVTYEGSYTGLSPEEKLAGKPPPEERQAKITQELRRTATRRLGSVSRVTYGPEGRPTFISDTGETYTPSRVRLYETGSISERAFIGSLGSGAETYTPPIRTSVRPQQADITLGPGMTAKANIPAGPGDTTQSVRPIVFPEKKPKKVIIGVRASTQEEIRKAQLAQSPGGAFISQIVQSFKEPSTISETLQTGQPPEVLGAGVTLAGLIFAGKGGGKAVTAAPKAGQAAAKFGPIIAPAVKTGVKAFGIQAVELAGILGTGRLIEKQATKKIAEETKAPIQTAIRVQEEKTEELIGKSKGFAGPLSFGISPQQIVYYLPGGQAIAPAVFPSLRSEQEKELEKFYRLRGVEEQNIQKAIEATQKATKIRGFTEAVAIVNIERIGEALGFPSIKKTLQKVTGKQIASGVMQKEIAKRSAAAAVGLGAAEGFYGSTAQVISRGQTPKEALTGESLKRALLFSAVGGVTAPTFQYLTVGTALTKPKTSKGIYYVGQALDFPQEALGDIAEAGMRRIKGRLGFDVSIPSVYRFGVRTPASLPAIVLQPGQDVPTLTQTKTSTKTRAETATAPPGTVYEMITGQKQPTTTQQRVGVSSLGIVTTSTGTTQTAQAREQTPEQTPETTQQTQQQTATSTFLGIPTIFPSITPSPGGFAFPPIFPFSTGQRGRSAGQKKSKFIDELAAGRILIGRLIGGANRTPINKLILNPNPKKRKKRRRI